MKDKSSAFWFFGIFSAAFTLFMVVVIAVFPISKSVVPMVITGILLFALVSFLLIRKAVRIGKNNAAIQSEGVATVATVISHDRSFNLFSSSRYYVITCKIADTDPPVVCSVKSTRSAVFAQYPVGSQIQVLYHPSRKTILIQDI